MNQILRIADLAARLIETHQTRNPFELAERMGVRVVSCPDFQNLEGMYKVILGERFVFLNGNLRRRRAGLILAHELGHDLLHREMGEDSIVQDTFLLDMTLKPEFEANLFAAALLVPEEKLLSLLREGIPLAEAAKKLMVPEEIADLAVRIVREKGLLSL